MSSNAPARAASTEMSIFSFPPIFVLVAGIAVLVFYAAGNLMQIQSSEAWMLGLHPETWKLNFQLLQQWQQFFSGGLSSREYVAFIAAWGVQCIQLVMKIGLGYTQAYAVSKHTTPHHMHEGNVNAAKVRMAVWNLVSWGTVVWNSVTDWQYSADMGLGQQVLFVLVASITTFYLGTWGVLMMASSIGRIRKK